MNRRIETQRLILRPLTEQDAQDVFEWVGDPQVNRYMPYSLYQNIGQVKEWISSIEEDENLFGFFLKSQGKVIGSGDISYDPKRKDYELGARDFGANHANANAASGRVLAKCGFAFDHYGQYSRFDGSETFEASFYTLHLS